MDSCYSRVDNVIAYYNNSRKVDTVLHLTFYQIKDEDEDDDEQPGTSSGSVKSRFEVKYILITVGNKISNIG